MDPFVEQIAALTNLSQAEAADQLDRIVHKIVKKLRNGQSAVVPGVGVFRPGPDVKFEFKSEVQDALPKRPRSSSRRRP